VHYRNNSQAAALFYDCMSEFQHNVIKYYTVTTDWADAWSIRPGI